jgi:hypothetical protein
MADNLAVKDANGVAQTIAMTDVASVLLPKHKLNDGTNDIKSGSAANLSGTSGANALMATPPGQWAVNHVPAVNTVATITKAAGAAGVRHVCTSLSFTLSAGTSAPTAAVKTVSLRDGATGAGTVLQSWAVGVEATAGRAHTVTLTGLNIVGSAATAMTLEFDSAAGANSFESVNLCGYSTS